MPDDIWTNTEAVREYIEVTKQDFHVLHSRLEQKALRSRPREQVGPPSGTNSFCFASSAARRQAASLLQPLRPDPQRANQRHVMEATA